MNTFEHLNRMSAHVGQFGRRMDWHLQGRAVVAWEFSSMTSWVRAKAELLDQLTQDPLFQAGLRLQEMTQGPGRFVDEHTWEVDCRDVTLRLTCRQVMMVQDGRRATVRDVR